MPYMQGNVSTNPVQTPAQLEAIYHQIHKNDYMERLEYYQKLSQ